MKIKLLKAPMRLPEKPISLKDWLYSKKEACCFSTCVAAILSWSLPVGRDDQERITSYTESWEAGSSEVTYCLKGNYFDCMSELYILFKLTKTVCLLRMWPHLNCLS